ncbi:hypothetical protein GE21DRAFT_993 [Neurospora crassa]|uniref:Uncharacterized protein n=1 Tax=Neurospora crassa (strain ATCC 24698 / 74-OR23-1A / CBS 708.71 / DSM 1257 / FGSC 987) TaxID=367110 RepID=V5IPC6_NEUCR|nr:hypothetical protein NCU16376 [Neurospora crassa OR74A]ESA43988.1 hypothetical protein NCU16376 [Neurospora crassa OR74A]KHE79453.1 hypothetical protein GE21DRAFT_993 [Neurospora crassa]|eukprot:XP_011393369.1 hypothetical protein NCU16376 [Neurospora crassa OR74A]
MHRQGPLSPGDEPIKQTVFATRLSMLRFCGTPPVRCRVVKSGIYIDRQFPVLPSVSRLDVRFPNQATSMLCSLSLDRRVHGRMDAQGQREEYLPGSWCARSTLATMAAQSRSLPMESSHTCFEHEFNFLINLAQVHDI